MALLDTGIMRGAVGDRPAASAATAGRLYIASDEGKIYRDNGSTWDEVVGMSSAPGPHHADHENGGSDEMSVAGLSGVLADAQTPASHNNTAHSETYVTAAGVTYDNLNANGDVGNGATQVAQGDHTHAGGGDVAGPGSATDNAIARFDSTTGKLLQNSLATLDDSGGVNIPTGQTYNINGSPHTHDATTRYGRAAFSIDGAAAIATGKLRWYNESGLTCTIFKVWVAADTPPTGAGLTIDIHKSGVTVFANQAHRPSVADGANYGSTTDIDVASWADGEYLTMDVDAVGSTVAGSDVTVGVEYTY